MSDKHSKASRMLDGVRRRLAPLPELAAREVHDTKVIATVQFVEHNTPQLTRSMEVFDSDGLRGLVAETVTRPAVKKVASKLESFLRRNSPNSERLRMLATAASHNSDLTKAICGTIVSVAVSNPVGVVIGSLKITKETMSILQGGKQASRDRRRFEETRKKLDEAVGRHRDKLKRIEGLSNYVRAGWSIAAEGNPVPLLTTVATDLSRVLTHLKQKLSRVEAERGEAERREAERREAERREAERREAERRQWAGLCGALTRDGKRCRNRVVGHGRCHLHS